MWRSLSKSLRTFTARFIHYAELSDQEVMVSHRLIYLPPTRQGVLLGSVLFLMLLGSMNYSNSLGFMFTFLITATAAVSILHSYQNISKLYLRSQHARPVFAGEMAEFPLIIENRSDNERYAICVSHALSETVCLNLASREPHKVMLQIPASKRGQITAGECQIRSRFPIGLVLTRVYVKNPASCIIYPTPSGHRPLPSPQSSSGGEQVVEGDGVDDFRGFRDYQPTDSARHIYWKAAAHSDKKLVKQFSGQGPAQLILDEELLADLPLETRLSQLCQWVIEAEAAGFQYGLRLSGNRDTPVDRGPQHEHECLTALALYDSKDQP